ncbi:MAG TPA: tetratricopeptide repeat protein [Pseudolabrys sp.]|jgi:predicted O-linked N-acetylglucosamine transferase (SPINDLY family)
MAQIPLSKAASPNVPQALAQALQLHERGQLAEAEKLYAAILAARPDHFDALQMMGLIKLAKGQAAEALHLMGAAMRARKSPQVLLNYGIVLNALKRHAEAIESFDQAIKLKSKYAEAHNNRGATLSSMGQDEAALESLRKAIAIKPDYVDAHYNLGSSLRALSHNEEALKSFDRTLTLRPNYLAAHNNRGLALEALNRVEEALEAYDKAITLNPGYSEGSINRARVLASQNRFDDSLETFAKAFAANPGDPELYYHRARLLLELNRNDDAAADLRKALVLRPNLAKARYAACFAELPILYADEAEIARRRASYETLLRVLCADVGSGKLTGDLSDAIKAKQPFLLSYQGLNDADLQRLYGAMISDVMQKQFPPAALAPLPAPGEPIRVGIVSGFFHGHSNWKIPIKGWLSQLDRSRFKLFGYYIGKTHDAATEAAASMCERFVNRDLNIEGWRKEILADQLHVLIYPGLLMDGFSLQLAAQRLAPVQCNSWGHPETSGMPTLDYFLSSDLMEPPDADAHYTEKLVRLPNLSVYYEQVDVEPVALTREELGIRTDIPAYWCGQSVFKYLPQYDDVFARIVKQAGDAQFVFLRHQSGTRVEELFQTRLERAFAAHGLKASGHCVFLPRMGLNKFVAASGLCDVFLDSIGWSGCNSALESLQNDVPIVTLRGALMRGQHSAAILQMMDIPETIAGTVDDYVAIAARLAGDPQERQALKERIAAKKHRLYRDRACIVALEDFLETSVRPR